MALFALADTHLSENSGKPMDIFGSRWSGWTEKLCRNWRSTVSDEDTVVIAGDISWAMSIEESLPDFRLIQSLPGKKIISKGNHDFWWGTISKTECFFEENGITDIKLLYNNSYEAENTVICGCRGWYTDEKNSPGGSDHKKIVAREAGRLELSLKSAEIFGKEKRRLVFFHFPPVFGSFVCRELVDILHKYGITECYYGHIHGKYDVPFRTGYEGINFRIISGDYLDFMPYRIL